MAQDPISAQPGAISPCPSDAVGCWSPALPSLGADIPAWPWPIPMKVPNAPGQGLAHWLPHWAPDPYCTLILADYNFWSMQSWEDQNQTCLASLPPSVSHSKHNFLYVTTTKKRKTWNVTPYLWKNSDGQRNTKYRETSIKHRAQLLSASQSCSLHVN